MLNDRNQKQEGGERSTNLQGQTIVVNQGITYADAKAIALDVYRANFLQLSQVAEATAKARVEEITEDFLSKLQKEYPEGFEKAHDPDFQYALFTVQKEYARSGDKELGDILVDILVDRSKQENRDILQIVLNESLQTAPKLTSSQIAVLSVVFALRYTQKNDILNHATLGKHFDRFLAPFHKLIVKNNAAYQHLEFAGCGQSSAFPIMIESLFGNYFQGLFTSGFSQEELAQKAISIGQDKRFFVECLNDASNIQVQANCKTSLSAKYEQCNISAEDQAKISALFDLRRMSNEEIKSKCIEIRPYMEDIFDCWSNSKMNSFTLTSVGIAIGHANIKKSAGEFGQLSIWIN
jgi:hypothetical protein